MGVSGSRSRVWGLGFLSTLKGFSSGLKFLNEKVVPARFASRSQRLEVGVEISEFRVGLTIQNSKVQDLGFGFKGKGIRVQGFKFRVWDLGLRVED